MPMLVVYLHKDLTYVCLILFQIAYDMYASIIRNVYMFNKAFRIQLGLEWRLCTFLFRSGTLTTILLNSEGFAVRLPLS